MIAQIKVPTIAAPTHENRTAPHFLSVFDPVHADRLRCKFGIQHLAADDLSAGLQTNIEEVKSAVAMIPASAISAEPERMKLACGLAHGAMIYKDQAEQLWEIFDAASRAAAGYDQGENRKRWVRCVDEASAWEQPINIATVYDMARKRGWKGWSPPAIPSTGNAPAHTGFGPTRSLSSIAPEKAEGVAVNDFHAHMPTHQYIFMPTREPWPASSVNARIKPILLQDKDGKPELDKDGKGIRLPANAWLDANKPVEQMTWAPGLPEVIRDRLIAEGGWIDRPNVACLNLYRPPTIVHGNAREAGPWVDQLKRVYPNDAEHITKFLAHRVQHPEQKVNHALLLGGSQGIGKDTVLEPVKHAVGPWNVAEVSPQSLVGRFNGYVKSVLLRVSEARDLGEVNRYGFYEHTKTLTAAPPDVLRCDEKNLREHAVMNVCGVIITTNHKMDGIYLPADDRRHYVAWSDLTKEDFEEDYWRKLWAWYGSGGLGHVAAYLAEFDLSGFDPKAPPPKTAAFFDIVDANRAPEEAELADIFDRMKNPDAVTLDRIKKEATGEIGDWVRDRKNRRAIPHRLEKCGFVAVRANTQAGLWIINGTRQVVYARSCLSLSDQLKAAQDLVQQAGSPRQ